jgi:hypothetical protein
LRNPGIDGDGIFKGIMEKYIAVCTGFIGFRIEPGCVLLWTTL